MKIAYIISSITNSGGTERILSVKANYFANHGYEVYIISSDTTNKKPFFEFDSAIQFYQLAVDNVNKKEYIDALTAAINNIDPDICIANGLGITYFLSEIQHRSKKIFEYHFSKYKRKSYFATMDKFYLGRIVSDIYHADKIRIAKSFDKYVVLTEEDKMSWRGIPNIISIPNPNSFVPSICSDNTSKRIIVVARFTYQKGLDRLIPIWNEVQKLHPDWKLAIYGDGHKRKKIISLIEKYNLQESIEIYEPSKDIATEYANSSICIMTSRYEGHPLVLPEAMSCGLPVVAYACKCGPRDIITDGEDGYVIEENDSRAFVDKLSLLMEDQALRQKMGQAGKRNIQRYSLGSIMPLWTNLFEELVNKNNI